MKENARLARIRMRLEECEGPNKTVGMTFETSERDDVIFLPKVNDSVTLRLPLILKEADFKKGGEGGKFESLRVLNYAKSLHLPLVSISLGLGKLFGVKDGLEGMTSYKLTASPNRGKSRKRRRGRKKSRV